MNLHHSLASFLCAAVSVIVLSAGPALGQEAGLVFDVSYLGFSTENPGSSLEIDLDSASQMVRLTAWTSSPSDKFQDFNIDVAPAPAASWTAMPGANWQLLNVTYQDTSKNLQVYVNLKEPFGIGTVTTEPIDPQMPMDNVPFTGLVDWIVFRAPEVADASVTAGVRPMPFGVFQTVTPTITVPALLLSDGQAHISQDDGWDNTADSVDITSLFIASGNDAVASNVPFRYGANRLTFVTSEGSFEAHSLNFDATTAGLVDSQMSSNLTALSFGEQDFSGATYTVIKNGVQAIMDDGVSQAGTSSFLKIYRIRPVGSANAFNLFAGLVFGLDLSGKTDGSGRTDLLDYVQTGPATSDPRVGMLMEDVVEVQDAVSEIIQPSIAVANANNYSVALRGWAGLPGVAAPQALAWAGEHFWFRTFPAHRAVANWRFLLRNGAPANLPVIGVFDSGFGFSIEGGNSAFPNNDMPVAVFNDLWLFGDELSAAPTHLNAGAVTAADIQNPRLADRVQGGHGTSVAHFVAGQGGYQKEGTGHSVQIAVMKCSSNDSGSFSSATRAAAISVAIQQTPQIRVMNFSNGGTILASDAATLAARIRYSELLFDGMSRAGVACVIAAGNSREIFQPPPPPVVGPDNRLVHTPDLVAPLRGTRAAVTATARFVQNAPPAGFDNFSPLVMRVSGLNLPTTAAGQESIWVAGAAAGSGTGNNISVAAYGNNLTGVQPDGTAETALGGTSFATPSVSGLVAEVIRLLDLGQATAAAQAPPTTVAARSARANLVLQALEMVEATADRVLGSNPAGAFDAAEQAPNDQMGFGRINSWKACLTAMNGGLAAGGTDQGVDAARTFGSISPPRLAFVDIAHTAYYGFDIRLQSGLAARAQMFSAAMAWLNDNPFDDQFNVPASLATALNDPAATANTDFTGANGGAAVRNIIAYKRTTTLNSRLPAGFDATVDLAGGVTEFAFSVQRTNVTATSTTAYKRLELRRNGQTATDQPFFTVPLRLDRLRNNAAGAGGNGSNIRFINFVFEILAVHVVAFNVNEVRGIRSDKEALNRDGEQPLTATLTDANGAGVNGVTVDFIVSNTTNGDPDNTGQIRVRAARGVNPAETVLHIPTAGAGAASVWVTRIAGAGTAAAVTSRILVRVNTVSAAGAAVGAQFPQEFTIPVRP